MRNPALRVLLVAVVALALIASAGGAAGGAATITSSPDADRTATSAAAAEALPAAAGSAGSLDERAALVDRDARDGKESLGDSPGAVRPQTEDDITSPSTTRIRIGLSPDRSADWTVAVRYALADENETAAFEAAAERFRDGEVGPDSELFEGFRREANRNVDRSMTIRDVDREAVVHDDPDEYDVATEESAAVGELRLTFTWTEFLAQDGESLILGDALTTPGNETWLRSLEAGQTLEVSTPEGYTVTGTPSTAVARLSDGDVIIDGPQTFDGGEPVAIVYGPAGAGAPPWLLLTGAVALVAALFAGVVWYRRSDSEDGGADEAASGGGNAPNGDDRGPTGAVDPDRAEGDAGGAGGAATDDSGDEDGPDLSLLSDEERVERLLDENGGRMRQADIVAETGWSDAKVSQLLSAMADEGRVEKLRLGRENLISLPDGEEGDGDADGEGGSEGSARGDERGT